MHRLERKTRDRRPPVHAVCQLCAVPALAAGSATIGVSGARSGLSAHFTARSSQVYALELSAAGEGDNRDQSLSAFGAVRYWTHEIPRFFQPQLETVIFVPFERFKARARPPNVAGSRAGWALQQAQKEIANAISALDSRIRNMEADMRALKAETKFDALKETQQMINAVQGAFNDKLTDVSVRLSRVENEHPSGASRLINFSKEGIARSGEDPTPA